ncbi:hypothetical protein TrLO_g14044 [Triparma laevis f. longispina]|uniref:Uncharacterized protein n=1 Tax=Triparma laevis f. longispina TaxID=1714387 RepID=A0A9W7FN11_9STRA|nr:hypothetical protein TrLO_g14044 [Triparma laevis f. longispina]
MERTGHGSLPIKGDHKLVKSSTTSRNKPPSPSITHSDNMNSRSSSRSSTKSPSTHRASPSLSSKDRRTPSPSFKKGGRKKSRESPLLSDGEKEKEKKEDSKERSRRSRSGPPRVGRNQTPDGKGGEGEKVEGEKVGGEGATQQQSTKENGSKKKDRARAPTELDKTFLATSSNIEDDVFVEKELEEIQSQLQERAAKAINTGSSFTRFTSKGGEGKKVSARRPSVTNSLLVSEFSDVASENSDISSSRLGLQREPILTVEGATEQLESMSLKDLEKLQEIINKKKEEKIKREKEAEFLAATVVEGTHTEEEGDGEEEDEENRGRVRADSIGPEIRRARTIARHEASNNENNNCVNSNNVNPAEDPVNPTTPPLLPTGAQSPAVTPGGTPITSGRPSAPTELMFTSYLGSKDSRSVEVAERIAQRDRENLRDIKAASGRAGKGHSFIGSMIDNDKMLSSASSSNDNTTDLDASSDLLCSMTSDTNSNFSYTGDGDVVVSDDEDMGETTKVLDKSGNVYSKSPKQLSFSYRRPPPHVPTLQLEVLRSPKSDKKFVSAPDPNRSMKNLTDGEAAFSPRSMTESEASADL